MCNSFFFDITWFLETSPNFFSRLSCRITVAQQYSPGIQSSLRFHSWPKGIFFFNLWNPLTNQQRFFFSESWDWDFSPFFFLLLLLLLLWFLCFFFGGSHSKAFQGILGHVLFVNTMKSQSNTIPFPLTTGPGKSLHLHCLPLPVRWSISRSHQAKKQNTQSFLGKLHQKSQHHERCEQSSSENLKNLSQKPATILEIPTNRCLTFNSWETSYSFTIQFWELMELKLELENQRLFGWYCWVINLVLIC